MARIYPLFSSSQGNAAYIGTPKWGILVDAGVPCKRLFSALETHEISPKSIQAVFITHEHIDHVRGLAVLSKRLGVPIYAREETLIRLSDGGMLQSYAEVMEEGEAVPAAGMEIRCFATPHDTAQSCGYRVSFEDGKSCAVCTDLGYVSRAVAEGTAGCDCVLLESNYDEDMLRRGPYPPVLRKRIRSDRGHLSNMDCGSHARQLVSSGTTRLILGHLSQENNTPAIADQTVEESLRGFSRNRDYLLYVAPVQTEEKGLCVAF